jgi:phage/plasmid-like protein (TIGR03299 family)
MPHDIDSMMYFGQTPWHGLGTRVDKPATAVEAIKAAGLDWEAIKVPVFAKHERGETLIPDTFAMMRSDRMVGADAAILGTVGSQYEPIQNKDAFRFFDPIVGEAAAVYHTAGSLGVGERVWILAKLPDDIKVAGQDITEKFLLLYNSHDGSGAAQVKFTPIRVVCQNTLSMALKGDSPLIKIAHTRGVSGRMDEVHQAVDFIKTTYAKIEDNFQAWAKVPVDDARLAKYIEQVFPLKETKDQNRAKKVEQFRRDVSKLFKDGKGNTAEGVKGTLWAAYNGVTEFADHRLVAGTRTQSGRVERLWFGDAAKLKESAYDAAAELADSWKKA